MPANQIHADQVGCAYISLNDHICNAGCSHCRHLHVIAQRIFVAVVTSLIVVDATVGLFWLLPSVCGGLTLRLQQALGIMVAANIIVNFTVCVFDSPGKQNVLIGSLVYSCVLNAKASPPLSFVLSIVLHMIVLQCILPL